MLARLHADDVAACEVHVRLAVDAEDRLLCRGDLDLDDASPPASTMLLSGARCGATGVTMISRDSGCMIGPPTLSEYAVLPVAVATMTPSAR